MRHHDALHTEIMDAPMPPEVAAAWTRFLAANHDLPAGRDVYPEIFADGWLFPLQRMAETAKMIAMARTIQPKTVIEIGTDKGGSFFHWIHGLPSVERAIAIEIRGVPFAEQFGSYFHGLNLLCLAASSYDPKTVRQVSDFLGTGPADCLFIDGDKANVGKDFYLYSPMVRPGGLIFIHDIVDDIEPRLFFKSLAPFFQLEEIVDTSEWPEFFEARERAGLPASNAYEQWFRVWKTSSCGCGVVHV